MNTGRIGKDFFLNNLVFVRYENFFFFKKKTVVTKTRVSIKVNNLYLRLTRFMEIAKNDLIKNHKQFSCSKYLIILCSNAKFFYYTRVSINYYAYRGKPRKLNPCVLLYVRYDRQKLVRFIP